MKTDRIIVRVDSVRKKFIQEYAKANSLTVSEIFRDWIDWLQNRAKNEHRSIKEIRSDGKDINTQTDRTRTARSSRICSEEEAVSPENSIH